MGALPREINPNDPNQVDVLYNGMIAPLEPFALKGAIWYQGESNAGQSRTIWPSFADSDQRLARAIRRAAAVLYRAVGGFHGARRRAEKRRLATSARRANAKPRKPCPNTGIAITTDIGDEKDIHPKNKQDVGAPGLVALAKTYGQNVEFSGPTVQNVKAKGDALTVTFAHADGGLIAQRRCDARLRRCGRRPQLVLGHAAHRRQSRNSDLSRRAQTPLCALWLVELCRAPRCITAPICPRRPSKRCHKMDSHLSTMKNQLITTGLLGITALFALTDDGSSGAYCYWHL